MKNKHLNSYVNDFFNEIGKTLPATPTNKRYLSILRTLSFTNVIDRCKSSSDLDCEIYSVRDLLECNVVPRREISSQYVINGKYGWGIHNFVISCLEKAGFSKKDFGMFLSFTKPKQVTVYLQIKSISDEDLKLCLKLKAKR